jgi:putative spermidine/putrescine transport system ATP-binding protein
MASVEVTNLSKNFGSFAALENVSVDFTDGGFYALLGPSGSGKTTLLRLIAGFGFPDKGHISIGGENVERVPLEKRNIGMVFQSYALFPNMNVFQNIAFGLDVRGVPREDAAKQVRHALELVQLSKLEDRKPHQLSGGQRQRVALARAIVINPRVLLLDEPLGALDKALRLDMQVELKRIQREVGITTIFVTHDQEEALTMSDRIGILRAGQLVEEGAPEEIYRRPKSRFAATFLGEANLFEGVWKGDRLELADGTLLETAPGDGPAREGEPGCCLVRPEQVSLAAGADGDRLNRVEGRIIRRLFAGNWTTVFVDYRGKTLRVGLANTDLGALAEGSAVTLSFSGDNTIPLR